MTRPIRPGDQGARLRLFASLDRATTSWRTWRRTGPPGWTAAPRSWPRTGMLRAGHAYELTDRKPTRRPRGTRSRGADPPEPALFPTPTASDGTGGPGTSPRRAGGMNLRTLVTTLPAPPSAGTAPTDGGTT